MGCWVYQDMSSSHQEHVPQCEKEFSRGSSGEFLPYASKVPAFLCQSICGLLCYVRLEGMRI